MDPIEHGFVYGTLAPGKPNQHMLADIEGHWQKATVIGTLHEEGWGANMGFPGIRISQGGQRTEGFMLSSKQFHQHWASLDAFEGAAYERILTTAEFPDKTSVSTYIYALKKGN